MNRPLRRVALACFVLFGLLLVNVNWVQVVKADAYRDDPRNSRVLLRTYERERGAIAVLAEAGRREAVAESTRTEGPLTWLRQYPGGPAYAHVTGYYSLVYGRSGVERAEDRVLSGEDDRLFVRRLSDYVTGNAPKGGTVVLTLDPQAQQAAYRALEGKRGAVVALDPRTGAVLAMVSRPSYDPAKLSSFEPAQIREYYQQLNEADDDPLLNRAISQTYPPGSTFKVVTAAAALAKGGVTPETQIPSPRQLDLPQTDRNLSNFGDSACTGETSTLADALRVSCNTAFGSLGLSLGAEDLREQAEAFGFNEGGLRVPTRVATSVFPSDEVSPPNLAFSAIGQYEVRATPLQMAMVAAGIANGGEVMKPHLVKEVQSPDFSVLDQPDPEVLKRAVDGDVADELTRMMELVVSDGSGGRAAIEGIRVAGKTGTAQGAEGAAPDVWFIGFAPADDPQIAVAVVVEDGGPLGTAGTGGAVSAPIAAQVMRALLRR
ncbi:MAG: Peptidoglycan glycosyltransferase [Frankiales bacterium]|nr:Peptidoglycan glycosyltransferase [Frankiales bacterium]